MNQSGRPEVFVGISLPSPSNPVVSAGSPLLAAGSVPYEANASGLPFA